MILIIRKTKIYVSVLIFTMLLMSCLLFAQVKKHIIHIWDASPNTYHIQGNDRHLKIFLVGDIMLGRYITEELKKNKKDYVYPFVKVKDIFEQDSVVFGNLECPITASEKCLDPSGKYILKNPVEALEGINYCGFNLLNLANNHILDYYEKGLDDTINFLDSVNIVHSGAGMNIEEAKKAAIIEKKSVKVGLIGYTDMADIIYGGNPPLKFSAEADKAGVSPRPPVFDDSIRKDIDRVRGKVDILIVSLHWGWEESFNISNSQIDFAHSLIDNGADIVVGTHPHQFQGIEIYKGKPIFYSLGNFMFDQADPENKESFIMKLAYQNKRLVSITGIPIRIINDMQVVPVQGNEAEAFLKREVELCGRLNTKCFVKDDKLVFEIKD